MELSEQFQYGPAFKNKPKSQGTLFRPARKGAGRTPESRQPRGFSPERRQEVVKALGTENLWGYHQFHNDTANTLARSTAPVEDMRNVRFRPDKNTDSGDLGSYEPGDKISGRAAQIRISPGRERTSTVLHEMGHHKDQTTTGGWYSKYAAASKSAPDYEADEIKAGARGQSEGFADNYADTHSRLPGYKRKVEKSTGYGDMHRPEDWHAGYGISGWDDQGEFDEKYINERYGSDSNLQKLQFKLEEQMPNSDPLKNRRNLKRIKERKSWATGQQELFGVDNYGDKKMKYFGPPGIGGRFPGIASNWIGKEPPGTPGSPNPETGKMWDDE